jgi:hypothetical protein
MKHFIAMSKYDRDKKEQKKYSSWKLLMKKIMSMKIDYKFHYFCAGCSTPLKGQVKKGKIDVSSCHKPKCSSRKHGTFIIFSLKDQIKEIFHSN